MAWSLGRLLVSDVLLVPRPSESCLWRVQSVYGSTKAMLQHLLRAHWVALFWALLGSQLNGPMLFT